MTLLIHKEDFMPFPYFLITNLAAFKFSDHRNAERKSRAQRLVRERDDVGMEQGKGVVTERESGFKNPLD